MLFNFFYFSYFSLIDFVCQDFRRLFALSDHRMSWFLEILRVILCCGEETSDVWNDETSYRSPSRECLLRRPDPSTMYYPNLGVNTSSGEGKSSVSSLYEVVVDTGRSQSNFSKSLKSTKEVVSQKSNSRGSSSILSESLSKPSPSYPNLSNLSPKVPIGSSRPSMPTTTSSGEGKSSVSSLYEVVVDTGGSQSDFSKSLKRTKEVVSQKSNLRGSSSILPEPLSKPSPSYSNLSNLSPKVPIGSSRPSMPTTPSQKISSKSSAPSSKPLPHSKVTLSKISSNSMDKGEKSNYIRVPKGESPFYAIPKDIEALIRKDIVPVILKKALTPTTYKDYFAALLYAEDFHIEKWSNFKLLNVTLELQEAVIHKMSDRNSYFDDNYKKEEKILVAFEIDSVHENRPFLISRDFVFARPSGKEVLPFQGFVYQVRKSTRVLVEFGEDFLSQHRSTRKYDVSFSFNRVCLKRAHQAVADASDMLFQNFLFPDHISRKNMALSPPPLHYVMDPDVRSVARQISSFQAAPPYLVKGPLCAPKARRDESDSNQLSKTGLAVQEAVVQIYRSSPARRILICAPTNRTCDVLEANLMKFIPESDIFRANAAFRGIDEELNEILLSCQNGEEHGVFSFPPLDELQEFRMIVSTFISTFRLRNEGIVAGHFSHLFLADASSATEPELLVALANFANQKTAVVVTGAPGDRTKWVRSDIAKQQGLTKSYFERLCESKPYKNLDPGFISVI